MAPTRISLALLLVGFLLSLGPPNPAESVLFRDGWTALPIPALCLPPSIQDDDNLFAAGTHLDLGDQDSIARLPEVSAFLPLVQLMDLLEADARQAGTDLRCLRTAPPLLARGSTAGIERARALLKELDRAGRVQRIQLTASLTPVNRSGQSTSKEAKHRIHSELRSGESTTVGTRHTTSFIADYDVEVATGVGTSFPILGSVQVGSTATLTAWRTPDEKSVFLSGSLDLSELLELASFEPQSPDLGPIGKPSVGSLELSFAGLIQSGGELLVEVRGAPLSQPDWNLSIRATTEADQTQNWRVVDLAWMEFAAQREPILGPGACLSLPDNDEIELAQNKPLSSAIMWAELQASFVGRSRSTRPLFAIAPGILIAPVDESQIWSELDPLLAAASQARSITQSISLQADALSIQFSCAEGLYCTVRSGVETSLLRDYEVELAKDYWMANPLVERMFDGFALQTRLLGGELVGRYWVSTTKQVDSFKTEHGLVSLPQRELQVGRLRVRAGNSVEVAPNLRVAVGTL